MDAFYSAFYNMLQNFGYTHPLHPTLTHLPIGTVIAVFLFRLGATLFSWHQLVVTARHCIILAFIFVFPTILLGYMDWQYFHGGTWSFVFKMKIIFAITLVILLSVSMLLHSKKSAASKLISSIYLLCFLTVVGLGYFGGEIAFGASAQTKDKAVKGDVQAEKPKDKVSFADVKEIFDRKCSTCHKGDNAAARLQLNTYEQVMRGSENGPVVISGKPGESELVLRIEGKSEPSMPFRQPLLPDDDIQTIVRWVTQGATRGGADQPTK
jgi:uncharacterized membrane protein